MPSHDGRWDSLRRKDLIPFGRAGSGRKDLAGLSLDDVLGNDSKPSPSPSQMRRTLREILREQEPGEHRDKKPWRRFKDRLRLQHAGATRSCSPEVPVSDIPSRNPGSFFRHEQKRNRQKGPGSDKFSRNCHVMAEENYCGGDDDRVCDPNGLSCSWPGMMQRTATGYSSPVQAPSESDEPTPGSAPEKPSDLWPQMAHHDSTKTGSIRRDSTRSLAHSESSLLGRDDPEFLGYGGESGRFSWQNLPTSSNERQMSAREAAAAQEASEAEAAVAREEEDHSGGLFVEGTTENQPPSRMSLMDLLEETDRRMGYTGSSYMIGEEASAAANDEDENHEEEAGEHSCSTCLVKHRGAPSGPCRHSFCKLCFKELRVSIGNCPACNKFNLEIVEVF